MKTKILARIASVATPGMALVLVLALVCMAMPVQARQAAPARDAEVHCLALTVYFEAAGEPLRGQQAVAHVVLNRVAQSHFPGGVCAVVRQGGTQRPCQFSWWCDGRSDRPEPGRRWESAQRVARDALAGRSADPTGGALYFHRADLGRLTWTQPLEVAARIGAHVYYR